MASGSIRAVCHLRGLYSDATADSLADADSAPTGDTAGNANSAADAGEVAGGDLLSAGDVPAESSETLPTCATICVTSDPCKKAFCDRASGQCELQKQDDGLPCDDGEPCTANATCQAGSCQGGALAAPCNCLNNTDCKAKDDGKLCNGVLFCDKSAAVWSCAVNPASLVNCPASEEACKVAVCLEPGEKGGAADVASCGVGFATDGTPCDDGKSSTIGDVCAQGACAVGTQTALCVQDADCGKYEDGDFCNGTMFCNKAKKACQVNPKSVVFCQTVDNTACQKSQCVAKSGQCVVAPIQESQACDDGNPCTAGEKCQKGSCTAAANTCDCQNNADCAKKEDGDTCNGTLFCDNSLHCVVNSASVVTCPVGLNTACSAQLCQKATGTCAATPLPDGLKCDADGTNCTQNDTCKKGVCTSDTNTCECTQDSECADDGDMCNGQPFCDKALHKCVVNPTTVVVCKSVLNTACQKNLCNPLSGECKLTNVNYLGSCDDGDPSTTADSCNSGVCGGVGTYACKQDSDCNDDGNPCYGKLVCKLSEGKCVSTPATVCDGGSDTACSQNLCDAKTGKCATKATNVDGRCDDGAKCTLGDVCDAAGKCVSGQDICCHSAADCSDGAPCNGAEFCDTAVFPFACGMAATPLKDGAICSDNSACTAGDGCKNALCQPGPAVSCDDANGCTADSCAAQSGCVFLNMTATCTDANPCTVGDKCQNAGCVAGVIDSCDDGDPCTNDSCDAKQGCIHIQNQAACTDGNPCTMNDGFVTGKCVAGKQLNCNDGSVCTTDSCDQKVGGCTYAPVADNLPCPEGNCKLGKCLGGGPTTAIALGKAHACRIDSKGQVWCWGGNTKGQLGVGSVGGSCGLHKVSNLKAATALDTGSGHVCALTSSDVRCWGGGNFGALGLGYYGSVGAATPVPGLTGMSLVAAGSNFTLASSGSIMAGWGMANNGSLSPNFSGFAVDPKKWQFANVVQIAALNSSCARRADGSVACWGGLFGPTLTEIGGLTNAIDIAVGVSGAAVRADGSVWAWDSATAKPVADAPLANHVAMGEAFACVSANNGTVACWGDNGYGQYGVPGAPAKLTIVPGIAGATHVGAGRQHACAIVAGGAVWCWGRDVAAGCAGGLWRRFGQRFGWRDYACS
ncbi:MAG: hypothetical protein EXR77_17585 [Myxococcales bacterium]|nr:hypothetical protein [Myxococcales bacterium]